MEPSIGSKIKYVLFGHPPKRCKMRTGDIIYVQEDGLYLVQDPQYTRPLVFEGSISVQGAKRCPSCSLLYRAGLTCEICSVNLIFVNRSPARYYVHQILTPPVSSDMLKASTMEEP